MGNDSYWDGGTRNPCSKFFQDEEGNPEPFVAKLRSQYVSEKQEYLQELKNSLGDVTYVQRSGLMGVGTVDQNPPMDTGTHHSCAGTQI